MTAAARRPGALWRAAVDTGGTFTDCIVLPIGPGLGRARRAKVLSTSALRCRLFEGRGRRWRFLAPWTAPDGFLRGARWVILGAEERSGRIVDSGRDGWLELEADAGAEPDRSSGSTLEARFDVEAPILALRLALGIVPGTPLPPIDLRLATTRGTNALLERRGARVVLVVTAGFGDLLEIGDQRRPDLFARVVRKPAPLHEWVLEVGERLAADGSVVRPLELETLAARARELRAAGADGAAVALLHSYRNPEHEARVVECLRGAGLRWVVSSADLTPLQRVVPRAETAVVEAYLAPAFAAYLEGVARELDDGSPLHVMTSAGGLASPRSFRAKDGLLSGPAAGVVGVAAAARRAGLARVLGFDMGGTSTDATRWSGAFTYRFESRVGDAAVLAPSLEIETVAAGGGSICGFDGELLTVGPRSAGAAPGPACYGAGGPLTLTDVNLLLGRLWPARFELPLDRAAGEAALGGILERLPAPADATATLDGFLAIANERMAGAIRAVSVREGYDPAEFALVSFGGAGGQHACAVAELLGIDTILVPEDTSLLSARGLAAARLERFVEAQVLEPLDVVASGLPGTWASLARRAGAGLEDEGIAAGAWEVTRRIASLRLRGQETTVALDVAEDGNDLRAAFLSAYRALYGYEAPNRPIEVESLRVVAAALEPAAGASFTPDPEAAPEAESALAWTGSNWAQVPLVGRADLSGRGPIAGPALVVERFSAVWLAPGWSAAATRDRDLLLRRSDPPSMPQSP